MSSTRSGKFILTVTSSIGDDVFLKMHRKLMVCDILRRYWQSRGMHHQDVQEVLRVHGLLEEEVPEEGDED